MLCRRQRFLSVICVGILTPMFAHADEASLVAALQKTYSACVGIDDSLTDLKKMAGINTAITGVGTGIGVGATVVGIVKSQKDAEAKRIADKINYTEKPYQVMPTEAEMNEMRNEFNSANLQNQFDELRRQSKTLGNWRTGLLAGNTATNIAGAIIAGKNRTDGDLQNQIDNCKTAIGELRRARAQARIDKIDVSEANAIVSACEGFETVDISKINSRAKGAMISGIVGATTGLAGTITSGVANSESVRKDGLKPSEKTNADWDKEKNINTAANVLAGASTVASGAATVFNATQIKAIKDVANVAAKCTEALK
jgi:hypothetical protein